MLHSIFFGLFLTAVTIAIHSIGTTLWIQKLRNLRDQQAPHSDLTLFAALRVLCSTAVVLLLVHILEVVTWAIAYRVLTIEVFSSFEETLYFSTVTMASLGYGDIVITGSWRLLSAIQSMIGLLVFGWSSALLFSVVQTILRADSLPRAESSGRQADDDRNGS